MLHKSAAAPLTAARSVSNKYLDSKFKHLSVFSKVYIPGVQYYGGWQSGRGEVSEVSEVSKTPGLRSPGCPKVARDGYSENTRDKVRRGGGGGGCP